MKLIAIAQLKPGAERSAKKTDFVYSTFYDRGRDKAYRISPTEKSETGFPINGITERIKQNGSWLFTLEILYE